MNPLRRCATAALVRMMYRKTLLLIAAVACAAVGFSGGEATAEAVTNGDFSSNGALFTTAPGYRGAGTNPAEIDFWTFSSSGDGNAGINGDGVAAGDPFGPSDDSAASLYAFVQGSGGDEQISQVLSLMPNTLYDVAFLAASRSENPSATGQVTIGDNSTTYYDSGSQNWDNSAFESRTGQFSTSSSFDGDVVIRLINTTPTGDNTVNYANISVTAVPEPSSLALAALGLASLLGFARRKR